MLETGVVVTELGVVLTLLHVLDGEGGVETLRNRFICATS